jgi:hypothetical protein
MSRLGHDDRPTTHYACLFAGVLERGQVMSQAFSPPPGLQPEALSNELLKLKIDDLYQEIETVKNRLTRLESQLTPHPRSGPEGIDPNQGVVSNPDAGR